jgi:predicted RNase H-like HicB family nuclease
LKTYVFRAQIEQYEDGRWGAEIPSLPGCATWGCTKEEAMEALQDAAQAYIEVLLEDGDPLPRGEEEVANIIPGSEFVSVTV